MPSIAQIEYPNNDRFNVAPVSNADNQCIQRRLPGTPDLYNCWRSLFGVEATDFTLENITLHNPRLIRERDLRVGDTVAVVRRGDVIPFAGRSIPEDRDGTEEVIEPPTHCPSCGTELEVGWRFCTTCGRDVGPTSL